MKVRNGNLAPQKRPTNLPSETHKVPIGCGHNMYITVTLDEKRDPAEIFVNVSKAGTCVLAQVNALCRSISLGLRSGIPVKHYTNTLSHITCDNPVLGGAKSCGDGISRILALYTRETKK